MALDRATWQAPHRDLAPTVGDRVVRLAAGVLCTAVLMGCYSLHPISTGVSPEIGSSVALRINDVGRVGLAGQMGSGVEVIEGRLLEHSGGAFVVSVHTVRVSDGSVQVWSNEVVRAEEGFVRSIAERRLSRGRTIAAGALGMGGFAFVASRGLLGFGLGSDDPVPTDTGVVQLRIIWP